MADSFDPYLRWLGIRDPVRPPNHYRLLGLDLFENDSDVIAVAADRQMAHVRTFQTGQFAPLSQRLLNELAAARICLLKPEKKAVYDGLLKQQLGSVPVAARPKPQSASATAAASTVATSPAARQAVQQVAPPEASRAEVAADEFPDFASFATTSPGGSASAHRATKSGGLPRKKKSVAPWIGLAAAAMLLVVGVVVIQSLNGDSSNRDSTNANSKNTPSNSHSPANVARTEKLSPAPASTPAATTAPHDKSAASSLASTQSAERPSPSTAGTPAAHDDHSGHGEHGDHSIPPSAAATANPPRGSPGRPREPPLHSASDVALVENPPQHDSTDAAASADKPQKHSNSDKADSDDTSSGKTSSDKTSRDKTSHDKTAGAKSSAAAPGHESPAKPALPPVPDKEALAAAEKTILSIYRPDFEQANRGGAAAKAALAKQMMARGIETSDNSAARYALLMRARDLAIAGGDVSVASAAVKKLATLYAIERPDEQLLPCFTALSKTIRSRDAAGQLRMAAESASDAAFAADNFELAAKYARLATSIATKLRDSVSAAELKSKLAEIEQCKKEFAKLPDMLVRLQTDPADPAANLAVGRFYGFTKGDFEKALPYLAKSGDASLADLAKKDLAAPTTPAAQVKLGNAWWTLAESTHDPAKSHLQSQAALWYSKAAPKLTGLDKGEVEARLKQASALGAGVGIGARERIVKIITGGQWHIQFMANPSIANSTDHHGYQYLHYRFLTDGTVKNEVTPPGHWTLDGDTVSVVYQGWSDVLHKFRVSGDSLVGEAYRPPDPALRNRGVGTRAD